MKNVLWQNRLRNLSVSFVALTNVNSKPELTKYSGAGTQHQHPFHLHCSSETVSHLRNFLIANCCKNKKRYKTTYWHHSKYADFCFETLFSEGVLMLVFQRWTVRPREQSDKKNERSCLVPCIAVYIFAIWMDYQLFQPATIPRCIYSGNWRRLHKWPRLATKQHLVMFASANTTCHL